MGKSGVMCGSGKEWRNDVKIRQRWPGYGFWGHQISEGEALIPGAIVAEITVGGGGQHQPLVPRPLRQKGIHYAVQHM
ncbi:hypothetical protein Pmani_037956 [Petrolisthes manimaculis]|uniref:Uncharacterized protein n=1 Tax=Petrolisthes manimaculis TaxID=1843537 RepID=A0AAE1NHC1_9EUCA|nr:hypothetical protein Pmani_037956 [Petrolisthes manimaculis]